MSAFAIGRRLGLGLLGEVVLVLTTILVLFVLVYPTAWVLLASFKTPETMFAATQWQFTLQNYVQVISSGFGRNFLNSVGLCAVSVLISTYVVRVPVMWRQAPITATIVVAGGLAEPSRIYGMRQGVERVGDVLLGCLVGLLVSFAMSRLWPATNEEGAGRTERCDRRAVSRAHPGCTNTVSW